MLVIIQGGGIMGKEGGIAVENFCEAKVFHRTKNLKLITKNYGD